MFFDGIIGLTEFYSRFGGRRGKAIYVPRNKPFIFMFYSQELHQNNNLQINDAPQELRFAFDGDVNRGNNAAVLNHAGNNERIYKSLLVFYIREEGIRQLGEYCVDEQAYEEDGDGNRFFHLNRVTDLDEVEVKLLVPGENDNQRYVAEILDGRAAYNYLDINIEEILAEDIAENDYRDYDFLDRNNRVIDIEGDTDEARKVQQYLYSIRGIHHELKKNNELISIRGGRRIIENYLPRLSPAFEPEDVNLYVVNVGWGLCQILVFRHKDIKEVWVFDCGGSAGICNANLGMCLNDIYGGEHYRVDKLFISHTHRDHFNEYNFFEFDSNTEVWINPNVRFCTNQYFNFLKTIKRNRCKVVEPEAHSTVGANIINILHPNGHIILDKRGSRLTTLSPIYFTTPRLRRLYDVDETTINQLSPIIQLDISGRKIIITGDAMQRSWFEYCNGHGRMDVDVYIHSHHGTDSGFLIDLPGLTNENDLFNADVQFASLIDGHHAGAWTINVDLARVRGLRRTDYPADIRYYVYDINTGNVDIVH